MNEQEARRLIDGLTREEKEQLLRLIAAIKRGRAA